MEVQVSKGIATMLEQLKSTLKSLNRIVKYLNNLY